MTEQLQTKIGTCGFGRVKRPEYGTLFDAVEIQHTFYQPPQIETLESWRAEQPYGFEFTVKAWQLITHETSSPTYRRLKRELNEKESAEAGFFKPTDIVREALAVTLASAKALKARTILFQCPAKFQPLPENILNMKRFFGEIDRDGFNLVWEPRGKWPDETIVELCDELGLWHCVDPFAHRTVTPDRTYYRLHGIPRWRYTYNDDELSDLSALIPKDRLAYIFFNNITMKDDALRCREIIGIS